VSGLRKILCPVDFSATSRQALQHAAELAQRFGAELIVLHALSDVPLASAYTGNPQTEELQTVRAWATKKLEEFTSGVATPGVAMRHELVHSSELGGTAERAIVQFAEKNGVDLIVMGKHGRKALEQFFFGSVTDRVLRHARCPVLVVPPAARE
jgi:nucleotide-binding universal stress UspA family protein